MQLSHGEGCGTDWPNQYIAVGPSSTTWRHLAGTIASAVAAITQLIGTAQPAHLSMQQVGWMEMLMCRGPKSSFGPRRFF